MVDMKRIAFVDLDGVVANAEARFVQAEEVKQAWLDKARSILLSIGKMEEREATNFYWRAVFDPEQVPLDTLIDGAVEAISFIERYPSDIEGYNVIYLTSRPESMRKATYDWLYGYELSGPLLIMKTSAFIKGYIKTVPWKAGIVQTIASLFNTTHVLFIDDEQTNRDALVEAGGSFEHLIVASSLADAVGKLKEQELSK
jgi:hypothetical protein